MNENLEIIYLYFKLEGFDYESLPQSLRLLFTIYELISKGTPWNLFDYLTPES